MWTGPDGSVRKEPGKVWPEGQIFAVTTRSESAWELPGSRVGLQESGRARGQERPVMPPSFADLPEPLSAPRGGLPMLRQPLPDSSPSDRPHERPIARLRG